MKTTEKISEFTIYRLSIYKRCLEQLQREGIKTISSKDFALRFGLNSAQVRKDLAYFGEFGIRGMGYPVSTLKEQILTILGLAECAAGTKTWKAIIIGAGQLGTTLAQYAGLRKQGFEIRAVLDADPPGSAYTQRQQIGLLSADIPLRSIDHLETLLEEQPIDIVILAVPEDDAQQIADRVVKAGVQAILNFVPVQLLVPPDVKVRTVDMVAELQSLTYHLHQAEKAVENEQIPSQ
jgi:redox-sensing transcriptional repressor